jgi:Cdc6-like AAA superfamily ATPase
MASNKMKETGAEQKEASLKQIELRLEEICMWLRFQNRAALKTLLEDVLRTKRDRMIYELTNGSKSITEIAQAASLSQPRISQIWAQWKELGIIMESAGARGRYRHICSLSQLGLEIGSS